MARRSGGCNADDGDWTEGGMMRLERWLVGAGVRWDRRAVELVDAGSPRAALVAGGAGVLAAADLLEGQVIARISKRCVCPRIDRCKLCTTGVLLCADPSRVRLRRARPPSRSRSLPHARVRLQRCPVGGGVAAC